MVTDGSGGNCHHAVQGRNPFLLLEVILSPLLSAGLRQERRERVLQEATAHPASNLAAE
jgi:hypothetical protein